MSSYLGYAIFGVILLTACGGGGGDATTPSVASTATFGRIGFITNTTESRPSAVSGNGLVIVGNTRSITGESLAFRWTEFEGIKSLGLMESGSFSDARAVSADGSVVVGNGDTQDRTSTVFRWTMNTGMRELSALSNAKLCVAGGVSGDGNSVIGTCLLAGNSAFHWTEQTGSVSLGQLGGGSNRTSNALAISSDGSTVVGVGHPVLTGAVVWNLHAETRLLGTLPGDTSAAANAVSRDGSVVAGYSINAESRQRAFRWTALTGMTALTSTESTLFEVNVSAVSGDGRLMVGWGGTPNEEVAVVWDEFHGVRRLVDMLKLDYQTTIEGWILTRATGISDDGRTIVGYGTNPDGRTEGWVLILRK